MKTSLEDISSVRKKLLVEVEAQVVDKKFDEAYKALGKKARIPGFRPGKVPKTILKNYFAKQVVEDVANYLINDTLPKAIEESNLYPLGLPSLEKESIPKQGQNFKYVALMEVEPKFELKDYLGIELKRETYTVSEEDIQNRLRQIQTANAKLVSFDGDKAVETDDYVVLDYEAFEGGRPMEGIRAENFLLKVGSNSLHPKVEEALIGLGKGEEREIEVVFDSEYYHPRLTGKTVNFKVRIADIKMMELPELDDDFASKLDAGFNTFEDLRSKVIETLIAEQEKNTNKELKQKLLESISDGIDFELPETLVQAEIEYAMENLRQNLSRSGSTFEKTGLSEEKLRSDFRPASEKRVKEMLILAGIAREREVTVDEDDLDSSFKDIASRIGQPTETIRKYYEGRNLMGTLKQHLLEEKTLNYLVEHANVKEVDRQSLNGEKETDRENE